MRRRPDDNFWISYADLATGTMVVFLVISAVLIAVNQKQEEERATKVEELARQVQIILGTRAQLAEHIHTAISEDKSTEVDPVTAQLVFEDVEGGIQFEERDFRLKEGGKRFLREFVPPYFCALWQFEQARCTESGRASCERLDPELPNAVRRVLVTGHADLKGDFEFNQGLSRNRAGEVISYALETLGDSSRTAPPCAGQADAVLRYAEERLYAIGAGDIEHCREQLSAGSVLPCSEDETEKASARRVTFELELTGSDMTGLIDDLLELRRVADSSRAAADPGASEGLADDMPSLEALRDQVAARCWVDPGKYHGCDAFIRRCLDKLESPPADLPHHCAVLVETMAQCDSDLRRHVCAAHPDRCSEGPLADLCSAARTP